MKRSLISNYIILWMHIISLTFRLFFEITLKEFGMFKLDIRDLNLYLNNLLSVDYIFDNGVIDILTLITAIISFNLGKYYLDSFLMLIISTIMIEVMIILNNIEGRILNSFLIVVCFYILGKLTVKNKNTYLLEKSLKNKNIFDEINTQEYEPYKLY
jgi:hypothetical protein